MLNKASHCKKILAITSSKKSFSESKNQNENPTQSRPIAKYKIMSKQNCKTRHSILSQT